MIGVCYLLITKKDGSAIQDTHCFLAMNKIENENDLANLDGYFYQLKASHQKAGEVLKAITFQQSDKLKDFIEVKVKVVSTQLTQNGRIFETIFIYRVFFNNFVC